MVLFHTQYIFGAATGRIPFFNIFAAGNRGVDLFFVLSGFIVAYVHGRDIGQPRRLPNYAFNRFARLYPAVWILSVLALVLYALGFGTADKAQKLGAWPIIASLLLLPQNDVPLINVTWTLVYELMFYVFFSSLIISRFAGIAILLSWQLAIVASAAPIRDAFPSSIYLDPLCLEFGLGMACAWWLRRGAAAMRASAWIIMLASGIVAFIAGMALDPALPWAGVPCALGAGATILACARIEQTNPTHMPAWIVKLGGASYSIYLVHYSVIKILAVILVNACVPISNVVCLACAAAGVGFGILFDRYLDKPVQRWLQHSKVKVLGVSTAKTAVCDGKEIRHSS